MADYSKMKNAELESILKERSLPHTGKKAELVARLVEDDKAKASSKAAPSTSLPVSKVEDDITWDDDDDPAVSTANASAAGAGAGDTSRPKTVPAATHQATSGQSSKTKGVSGQKSPPVPTTTAATIDSFVSNKVSITEAQAAPIQDFTSGLPSTDVDAELEKRKRRAAKFGMPIPASTPSNGNIENSDAIKALERAKRFGGDTGTSVMSRLDGALPERPQRRDKKRGSDAMLDADKDQALEDPGLKRVRGGRGKRGGIGGRGGDRDGEANSTDAGRSWMSDSDRAKAEARKNKWAAPAAS